MTTGILPAAVVWFALLLAIVACGSGSTSDAGGHGDGDALFPKLPKITGHIDQVVADPDNPRHFTNLQITDANGQRWRFESAGWVGVSAGHLKDHQIHGTSITIWYQSRDDGKLLARFVGD